MKTLDVIINNLKKRKDDRYWKLDKEEQFFGVQGKNDIDKYGEN